VLTDKIDPTRLVGTVFSITVSLKSCEANADSSYRAASFGLEMTITTLVFEALAGVSGASIARGTEATPTAIAAKVVPTRRLGFRTRSRVAPPRKLKVTDHHGTPSSKRAEAINLASAPWRNLHRAG
jgi:hypothetical protein